MGGVVFFAQNEADAMPPFTRDMARRHKKGLSAKQQRMWVHIATSAFAKCKREGGSDGACEASAIRQANGATGSPAGNVRRLVVEAALTVLPHRTTLHNREYLVAPAVLIVEGVLNGAYIPEAALVAQHWDGVPIVVGHPMDADGIPISARSPEVIEQYGIGHVYRAQLGLGQRGAQTVRSLQSELWIDMDRAEALGGDALQAMEMIENGLPLEVSTGFYSEAVPQPGLFQQTPYIETLANLRPDHLAVLPKTLGACSWADGCGVPRLNHTTTPCNCTSATCTCQETPMDEPTPQGWRGFMQMLRDFVHRESHATEHAITIQEDATDEDRTSPEEPEAMLEAPDEDEEDIETDYEEEEPAMPLAPTTAVKARVNELIQNPRRSYTELDRPKLEALDEAMLMVLQSQPLGPEPVQEAPPREGYLSIDEALQSVSPEERDLMKVGLTRELRRKTQMVEAISSLKESPYTNEELQAMEVARLEKLVIMAGLQLPGQTSPAPAANFTGRRMPHLRIVSSEDGQDDTRPPPLPSTMELVVEEKTRRGIRF